MTALSSTLVVPGTVASLAAVAEFLDRAAAAASLEPKDAYRLRLATDELITNAITHGRSGSDIELQVSATDGRVLLVLVDSAGEFDPTCEDRRDPDGPGGFGLALTRMGADRLAYERDGDQNRTVIVVLRSGRSLTDHEER